MMYVCMLCMYVCRHMYIKYTHIGISVYTCKKPNMINMVLFLLLKIIVIRMNIVNIRNNILLECCLVFFLFLLLFLFF